jgi:hypothetical protein
LWNSGDPYWEQYSQVANVILPPAFWAAIIGMGLLLPFTIAGFYFWFKHSRNLLIPIWAVVNFMALYFPFFIFSGRFALGLFIPVASLAAVGLEVIILPWLARTEFFAAFSRLTPTPYATLRRVILLLLIPSALMAILLFTKGPLVQKEFPYYWPEADVQAAKWLGEVSSEKDVTLAYYPMGNFLPQVYPGKVFMGQKFLTTDLDIKLEQYKQFWDGSMSDEEMLEFLHLWGISYIFSGTYEKPFRMDTALDFTKVYSKDGVEIYRVP